jgi:SAM-dependent methyltransferase
VVPQAGKHVLLAGAQAIGGVKRRAVGVVRFPVEIGAACQQVLRGAALAAGPDGRSCPFCASYHCRVAGTEPRESEAELADRRRRGSSFGAAAAEYAQHRPAYADAAIRWCLAPVTDAQPLRVADLGAGTGILTRALADLGAVVVAVEPDPKMLAELRRQLPGVRALAGGAEAIPLPDESVDAVLCGQAMHWFDMERAVPEIARVLAPGGVLAGLWNVRDDRVGWVAELTAMGNSGPTFSSWRTSPDGPPERGRLRAGSEWFSPAEEREFAHGQLRDADSLLAAIATHSRMLVMDEAERRRTMAAIHDFLGRRPETSAGEFTLPLVTVAVRVVRLLPRATSTLS